ncbi:MAG TPA: amino acid adenylation domain-containing protein, partial [Blastocatellia bacterium]|nr:amino acid adenylation domain-containing protein [Blastocatellia bacterium]
MADSTDRISDLSPEKLSLLAMQFKKGAASRSGGVLSRVDRPAEFPPTVAQEQLWFFDQLLPGTPAYNMPFPLRCADQFNVLVLSHAITEICRRHESLRTTFDARHDRPVQIIHQFVWRNQGLVDLRGLDLHERRTVSEQLASEEALRPFDLACGPLFRGTVVMVSPEETALLRTMHHTICDGWSVGILNRELIQLSVAFASGVPSPLPELAVQLADYALWEQQRLQGSALKEQVAYWKERLSGLPTMDLPTDRPRPPIQTFDGAKCAVTLPVELSRQLSELSRKNRTTLFVLLMALYEFLLAQYAGQEDVVVGTPIAGRSRAEHQNLIGPIFNILVMRTLVAEDLSFEQLLARVHEAATQAYSNPDVPFQKLVEELQRQRDVSRSPLFQVTFGLKNLPPLEAGQPFDPLPFSLQTARYDLELHLSDHAGGITGFFVYNTRLFDGATIERLAKHFRRSAEQVAACATRPLCTISILTAAERFQLLETWNRTRRDYPAHKCVHEMIQAQADRNPDSIAMVFESEALTYGTINRRANSLAHHLRSLGIGAEQLVGVFIERSPALVVSLLAILKAGAAYLPLDPSYPKERVSYMLRDSKLTLLLTEDRLVQRLPEHSVSRMLVDGDWPQISGCPGANPVNAVVPGNLAYVIYTSGSTGEPKAVQISHRGLLNLVHWHLKAFAVSSRDRSTQLSGTAFDAAGWELWPYLAAGATIHLITDDIRSSPEHLRDWLVSREVTISFMPTPLAETVLFLDWPPHTTLRAMLTGGDTLHHYPSPGLGFDLVNNYGPTENTVVATSGRVRGGKEQLAAPPIGRPIANAEIYLMDRHLRPVPVAIPGELHIGGGSLARGYLSDPALTASKFIPSPFGNQPGSRIYRTGDLARYHMDGNIEF